MVLPLGKMRPKRVLRICVLVCGLGFALASPLGCGLAPGMDLPSAGGENDPIDGDGDANAGDGDGDGLTDGGGDGDLGAAGSPSGGAAQLGWGGGGAPGTSHCQDGAGQQMGGTACN